MTYGLIDRRSHKSYTSMRAVFDGICNAQNRYNWLITDCVCYPKSKEIEKQFDQEYCWLSGEELSAIIEKEDFQWIWAVLCGFPKDIPLEKYWNIHCCRRRSIMGITVIPYLFSIRWRRLKSFQATVHGCLWSAKRKRLLISIKRSSRKQRIYLYSTKRKHRFTAFACALQKETAFVHRT